jgi:hypothetical protein
MPPQQGNGLLDVIDGAGDFGTHGRDIRRSIWKVKPLFDAAFAGPLDLLTRFARRG